MSVSDAVDGERERERAGDDRDRPCERRRPAGDAERTRKEPAGREQDERRGGEPQPEAEAVLGQEPRDAEQRQCEEQGHASRSDDPARREPGGALAVHAPPRPAVDPAAQPQRREEERPRALGVALAAVLAEEAELAAEVLGEEQPPVRGGVDVGRPGARVEQELPTGAGEPIRPVGLLAEEEERVVGRPDLVDRSAADEPHGAHQHLGLPDGGVVETGAVEGVQGARARGELAQEEELRREPPQRRVAAHGALKAAVGIAKTRRRRRRRRDARRRRRRAQRAHRRRATRPS